MPKITLDDFKGDTVERLRLITCSKMGINLMSRFSTLNPNKKAKFNYIMNLYINTLTVDWEKEILDTFNDIVLENLLNEDFCPEKQFVMENDTEVKDLSTDEERQKCEDYLADWKEKNALLIEETARVKAEELLAEEAVAEEAEAKEAGVSIEGV